MTQTLLQHSSTLRDIRLSVLGFHREERLSPPVDIEAMRRKIEHEAYRRGVSTATEACEEPLGEAVEGGLDEQVADSIKALMDSIVDSAEAFRDAEVERILGTKLGLSDISAIAERHGYSAFHIEGYSQGGDEYVIFDNAYLPVKVLPVE